MPRLRWTGPDSPALLVAPVFFSLWFFTFYAVPWQGFLGLLAATLPVAALCLLAPALLRLDQSLGTIPARLFRLALLGWVILWLAETIWTSCLAFRDGTPPAGTIVLFSAATLAFLAATVLAGRPGASELGRFSLKLGAAFLLAGLIRVHDGWFAIPEGLIHPEPGISPFRETGSILQRSLTVLGPLAVLAATLVPPARARRLAFFGFALPLSVALTALGVVAIATSRSRFYLPSLNANLAMALLGDAAPRIVPGLLLLLGVSNFGAIRFGVLAAAGLLPDRRRIPWLVLLLALVAGLGFLPPWNLDRARGPLTAVVLAASAALACPAPSAPRRVDWPATLGIAAGTAVSFCRPEDCALPAWGAAFLVTFALRRASKLSWINPHANPS